MLSSTVISCTGKTPGKLTLRAVRRASGGIFVWDEWDNYLVWLVDSDLPAGQPGVGARSTPAGDTNNIFRVELGPGDGMAPYPLDRYQLTSAYTGGCLYLRWTAATDTPDGSGVSHYRLARNDQFVGAPLLPELADCAVTLGQTYTYRFYVLDRHINWSPAVDIPITVGAGSGIPPSVVAPDAVRTGVRATGSYWGAGPEQIDTRSGVDAAEKRRQFSRSWPEPLRPPPIENDPLAGTR